MSRTEGGVEEFEAVARAVVEPVRRYLHRRTDAATADDALGEVLLVLWRRAADVPADPLPWAIGVARLCLANAERSRRRQHRLLTRIGPGAPEPDPTEDVAGALDDAARVRAALRTLKDADAELLRLQAWDGLSSDQLAQLLGITPNAVAIRLHRARGRLREALERQDPEPDRTGRGKGRA
ncbi:RNA polymerase sigma factor [Klenkia sp. PcliD-1-E]|uniref:RNA polymerase sigma factor n=1 Tax=Klenkia sp. PcliD-1-E TaxID=2954492 RepID=UPI0020968F78|nr:sigma-70 family RNA polymerase sigma factor [Klenkia sp. PcliD-1-E]MCO7219139.1 sigma-70 family RNA polymerase sigma factor [Klenkia sp. PcliD-1-E]